MNLSEFIDSIMDCQVVARTISLDYLGYFVVWNGSNTFRVFYYDDLSDTTDGCFGEKFVWTCDSDNPIKDVNEYAQAKLDELIAGEEI